MLYDITYVQNLRKDELVETEGTMVVSRCWVIWEIGRYWAKGINLQV